MSQGEVADTVRSLVRDGASFDRVVEAVGEDYETVFSVAFGEVDGADSSPLDSEAYVPWECQDGLVELYWEKDMKVTEIASVLDCHPETVKMWVEWLVDPKVVWLFVDGEVSGEVRLYNDDLEFSVEVDVDGAFFDDENVVVEVDDERDEKYVEVGMMHSSGVDLLDGSAPRLRGESSDLVVFPVGYEVAGREVGMVSTSEGLVQKLSSLEDNS